MSVLRHTQEEAGVGGRELRSSGAMLELHSEPCSTTLRCSRPTTRAVCRRDFWGADLPWCKNPIPIQAAQPAEARAQS